MPTAQVIQLDHYRQLPTEPSHLTKINKIRQLLSEAAPTSSMPAIIELLTAIKNQQVTMLNILKSAGGE